ncbi:MAG TPA: heme ABC exporter ATP-binding protein CcmA [Rhizomicrobium sp.]|nr:heme ABC exporter ATP-binding protein CcmA [Rhizomicrobium sp.]
MIQSLSTENLSCLRGNRLVFRDLNFAVRGGAVLAVEGANGSGKTSLLRMLAGFLTPAAGTIQFNAGSDTEDSEERGKFVGWLGHHDAVKPQMTPRETLRFFCDFYANTDEIDSTLETAGLSRVADLPSQYLSAGQKKRLALARLKLSNRPLWLLDEPLAALDVSGKALVAQLIQAHCASGGIAIAATHEPLGGDCGRLHLA